MAKLSIKNLLKATSLSLCLPMAALSGCIPSFPHRHGFGSNGGAV